MDKTIKERRVTVRVVNSPEEIPGCNICYISKKARPIISKFVNSVKSSGVLLMSATPDFGSAGVHINFYLEDEKLKFEINERSMVAAGLKASYLLMQNIRIIK